MAIRLSYSMFPWLRFKRAYTDFKSLRDRGKKNDSSVFEALVCPAGSWRLLETYLNVHTHARDQSCTQTNASPTSIHAETTVLSTWRSDGISALYSRVDRKKKIRHAYIISRNATVTNYALFQRFSCKRLY